MIETTRSTSKNAHIICFCNYKLLIQTSNDQRAASKQRPSTQIAPWELRNFKRDLHPFIINWGPIGNIDLPILTPTHIEPDTPSDRT